MTVDPLNSNALTQLEQSLRTNGMGAVADNEETPFNTEKADTAKRSEVDVPPDGGYGWVCVACVFWINAHTWGINSVCALRKTVTTCSADRVLVLWSFPRLLPCP